jgi:arginase family enzyme
MLEPPATAPYRYPTLFGCQSGAEGTVVVVGLPYDRGTPIEHSGAGLAPQLLRRLSAPEILRVRNGGLFDLARCECLIQGPMLSDLGDLKFRPSQSDDNYLCFASNAIRLLSEAGKYPLVLGGDHLVSLIALRGLAQAGRSVQIVHLDAHHDFDEVTADECPTHATFVNHVVSEGLAQQVLQIGVRGLSWGTPNLPDRVQSITLSALRDELIPNVDVYLTIDTDAFDPAVAPAVHFPEPCGLSLGALTEVISTLRAMDLRGVGADWTEYVPDLDLPNYVTGRFVLRGLATVLSYLATEPT